MASHPLSEQVAGVGRKARGWLLAGAFSAIVIVFIAAGLFAGAADYVLRFNDPGLRTLLSLLAPLCAAAAAWLFGWPALTARRSELQVAHRLEGYFPALRGRLATALEFLRSPPNDPTAGSPELRRATIAEVERIAGTVRLGEALDTRLPRALAMTAAVLAIALIALGSLFPQQSAIAWNRLRSPWGNDAWPQRNRLKFVSPPDKMALGDDLELTVIDANGRLPSLVQLEYRLGEGPVRREVMQPAGDRRASARINNVTQTLAVRAIGGDDLQSPWRRIEVFAPPRMVSLELTIQPPEYTRMPFETSATAIRALVGSRISLTGKADQPISRAAVQVETGAKSREIPLQIAADGVSIQTRQDAESSWTVAESGRWRLVLENSEGIRSTDALSDSLEAIPDEPPTITLDTANDVVQVTARGTYPLRGLVKDDLAVSMTAVEYRINADSGAPHTGTTELFRGPQPALAPPAGQEFTLNYRFDLSQIPDVGPGQTVELTVVAQDYLGQFSRSPVQRLAVVSDEELANALLARQTRLFAALAETLRVQRDARTLLQQEAPAGFTRQAEAVGLMQQSVHQRLDESSPGAAYETAALLAAYTDNRLESDEAVRRLSTLDKSLRLLLANELPLAEQRLLEMGRAESDSGADSWRQQALAAQDRIIEELDARLGELSDWDHFRSFARELSRLRHEQKLLLDEASRQLVASLSPDADPQQAAEALGRLSRTEKDLAERFDKLRLRMEQMQQRVAESSPETATLLQEALATAHRLAVASLLRSASRALQESQIAQGERFAGEALSGIDELLAVLTRRPDRQDRDRSRNLQAIRDALEALSQSQSQTRQKLEAAAAEVDDARRQSQLAAAAEEQQRLADEYFRMATQLGELAAPQASQRLGAAADAAQQAASRGRNGEGQEAADAARTAERAVNEAQAAIDEQLKSSEDHSADQRLAGLAKALQAIVGRQGQLLQEADSLAAEQATADGPDRSAAARTVELSENERQLAASTRELTASFSDAAAFEFALGSAAAAMDEAAQRWANRDLGESSRRLAQSALRMLEQLLSAIGPEAAPASPPADPSDGQETANDAADETNRNAGAAPFALAQLKVLLFAQTELERRTEELSQAAPAGPEQQAEVAALAEKQLRLAELLSRLAGNDSSSQPMPPQTP